MNKSNERFLTGVLMISVFCITNAIASPKVKVLGISTEHVGTNISAAKAESVNDSSTKPQRLGFIRTKKTGNTAQGTLVGITKSGTSIERNDKARAGTEKYIRTTGVSVSTVKPVTETVSNIDVSYDDFSNLANHTSNSETDLEQKQLPVSEDQTSESETVRLDEVIAETDNLQDAGDDVDANTNYDFSHGYHVAVPGGVNISENSTNM